MLKKPIMAKNPQDSISFSRRFLNRKNKPAATGHYPDGETEQKNPEKGKTLKWGEIVKPPALEKQSSKAKAPRKKIFAPVAVGKLLGRLRERARTQSPSGLVVGTLFGLRRGHVHLAIQEGFNLRPSFLVQLATPTSVLVKEMASGLVRIALECERRPEKKGPRLEEEPVWRTYCNGKKFGFAMRREWGPEERKVLDAIGPISMGAGVLPGEIMYMRAKFERVVGSRDSEAFYMMNPDGNGGPELSFYLLRL
ncbi:Protein of unknown function- DUF617 [Striga hermonthica]|uniref:Protein MIZU-KUSSEI 1 n=1 Tax=Striga hermonthica TaxID=68872 RepID=A0A9N7RGI3_STRHE|nr:Protein of unknown function- DUF617 [Striga hermonthica]